jgi:hypothetical protein
MSLVECVSPEPEVADERRPDSEWILREFLFDGELRRGAQGPPVKRVQELLVLGDHSIIIDGDLGPATERAATDFQFAMGLNRTGVIDAVTHDLLIQPLVRVLLPIRSEGLSLSELVVRYARQHLMEQPREVGGVNRGPWVRLYMRGRETPERPWCAGLVCFLMRQAADTLGVAPPLNHTFSCDVLAERARRAGLFVPGASLAAAERASIIRPGSLFLARKAPDHWTHAGVVVENPGDCFVSIEGNGNDEDNQDGHEVCRRVRGYADKDFIVYP